LLDLGYVAFFAIGAHVAGHFGSAFWANAGNGGGIALFVDEPAASMPGIHFNFLIILPLAIIATTIAGVVIGVPTLRVRGDYVGIVTLAFGEIIGQVASNGHEIEFLGGSLTGGPDGMSAVDKIDLPLLAPFGALDLRPWYWFALTLVALMLLVNFRLRDSRLGRAWIALRDDEGAAASSGVAIVRTKLLAYGVGAALGGVSGAFLASYLSTVNPNQFTFSFSIFVLAMVVLGGAGVDLGRRSRRDHSVGHQQLSPARGPLRRPGDGRTGLRPVGDLVRHLRLPDRDDHAPAAGRPAAATDAAPLQLNDPVLPTHYVS